MEANGLANASDFEDRAPFLDALSKAVGLATRAQKIEHDRAEVVRLLNAANEHFPRDKLRAEVKRLDAAWDSLRHSEQFSLAEKAFNDAVDARVQKQLKAAKENDFITRDQVINGNSVLASSISVKKLTDKVKIVEDDVAVLKRKRPGEEPADQAKKARIEGSAGIPSPSINVDEICDKIKTEVHNDLLVLFKNVLARTDLNTGMIDAQGRVMESVLRFLTTQGSTPIYVPKDGEAWAPLYEMLRGKTSTFFFSKAEQLVTVPTHSEVVGTQLDEKIKNYAGMVYDALNKKCAALKDENVELTRENAERKKENVELKENLAKMMARLDKLEARK